jgi:hypothetical protein
MPALRRFGGVATAKGRPEANPAVHVSPAMIAAGQTFSMSDYAMRSRSLHRLFLADGRRCQCSHEKL